MMVRDLIERLRTVRPSSEVVLVVRHDPLIGLPEIIHALEPDRIEVSQGVVTFAVQMRRSPAKVIPIRGDR